MSPILFNQNDSKSQKNNLTMHLTGELNNEMKLEDKPKDKVGSFMNT